MVAINHQNLRKVRFPLLKRSKATGAEGRAERRFGWEWDAMAGWHPLSAQRSFGPNRPLCGSYYCASWNWSQGKKESEKERESKWTGNASTSLADEKMLEVLWLRFGVDLQ